MAFVWRRKKLYWRGRLGGEYTLSELSLQAGRGPVTIRPLAQRRKHP